MGGASGPPGILRWGGCRDRAVPAALWSPCPSAGTAEAGVGLVCHFSRGVWGGLVPHGPVCSQTIFSHRLILAAATKIISAKTFAVTQDGKVCSDMLLKFS